MRGSAPTGLLLEIDVGEGMAVGVADDEAILAELHVGVVNGPWRREAAFGHRQITIPTQAMENMIAAAARIAASMSRPWR